MITASLSPEWRVLLLACATPTSETCRRLRDEFDRHAVDTNRMADCAGEHDLGPLLYDGLRANGVLDSLNDEARATLGAQYFATAIRNSLLTTELASLLRALRSRGTQVVVLKGAALAGTVYRNAALRPMRDIDLLVPADDLSAVETLFEESGYTLDDGHRARKDWYYRHHYHLTFHKRLAGGPTVYCDVHWRLDRVDRPFAIHVEGLLARSVPAAVGDAEARVLSPEDLLLHLCLHACKHRLVGGFRALCDIAETIRRLGPELDWEEVRTRAGEWRIDEFVYVPLRLVQELLAVDVPAQFMSALRPWTTDEDLLEAATAAVLIDRVGAALFPDFYDLCHGGSLVSRARALRKVFDPGAIARRYDLEPGTTSVYWYYPRRLKDIAATYGPRLWRFSRQPDEAVSTATAQARLAEWLAPFSNERSNSME